MDRLRALRRWVLTPNLSATTMQRRGFHVKSAAAKELLETIGSSFLTGYGYAAQARTVEEAESALEGVATRFRGFAYEGAAMGFAVRDGLPLGHGHHVADFLDGRGDQHVYMAYVGIGWAMARLPRWRWHRLAARDPLLRWLALDGYGFHQAYFRTDRYVYGQFREDRFRWPPEGPRSYAGRVIDQGIGRALWFVGGTDVEMVTRLVHAFAKHRRADLYSGVGLAATYAGGAEESELRELWQRAVGYRHHLAQGSAFAAGARVRADLVVTHNEVATQLFCGMSPAEAAKVTDEAKLDLRHDPSIPAYEVWRRKIAETFVSLGRCD